MSRKISVIIFPPETHARVKIFIIDIIIIYDIIYKNHFRIRRHYNIIYACGKSDILDILFLPKNVNRGVIL